MKKPESKLYGILAKVLEHCPIDLKRVENSMDLGTPDVYYVSMNAEGWAELKYIKDFPKRDSTTIKVPFRPGQYGWLKSRWYLNNNTINLLVIQIEGTLYVFKNHNIREEYTLEQLITTNSYASYINNIDVTKLFNLLNGK